MKPSTLVLIALIVSMPDTASGQPRGTSTSSTPAPAERNIADHASMDCDYNTCALRMKLSRGHWRIMSGDHERQIAKFGMFRAPNLESIVETSAEAQIEARTFRNNYTSGEVLQALGVVLMGAGIAVASADKSAVIPFTGVLGGGALLLYGVTRRVRAFNALHNSIWLYNRTLKR